jgi:hypothetical protein
VTSDDSVRVVTVVTDVIGDRMVTESNSVDSVDGVTVATDDSEW